MQEKMVNASVSEWKHPPVVVLKTFDIFESACQRPYAWQCIIRVHLNNIIAQLKVLDQRKRHFRYDSSRARYIHTNAPRAVLLNQIYGDSQHQRHQQKCEHFNFCVCFFVWALGAGKKCGRC